ncbi:MAG: M28 family peptidase [Clostridia bacterium]|nr:M28 family peptidase [Clostridia bacterium]
MTNTTKEVFEKYQVRKTKKQKTNFIEYVKSVAEQEGYSFKVEKGYFGAKNIVIGDPDTAKVVYTAHYDTCSVLPLPNFITPKNIWIYLLYQLVLAMLIFIPIAVFDFISDSLIMHLGLDPFYAFLSTEFVCFLVLWLLIGGPANKHTANDNTSGVTALFDIMTALPPESRNSVALIFFDLEEAGTIGSAAFSSKHKKAMKDKLLVNFDCISDGEHILFAVHKKARKFAPLLEQAFKANDNVTVEVATKGFFYPSDQANFPCGVGVAALKKTNKTNLLYMDRIHTNKDTVYREENIDFLVKGSVKLAELITE